MQQPQGVLLPKPDAGRAYDLSGLGLPTVCSLRTALPPDQGESSVVVDIPRGDDGLSKACVARAGFAECKSANAKLQRIASFMENLTLTSMAAKSASSSDADAP